jgi:hypothetical protein
MGLLNLFSKTPRPKLLRLPSGSFTLDKDGRVMTSTLPQCFPQEYLNAIGQQVLSALRTAQKAQMPLAELAIQYATLKLLARELRGGAIIFIMPAR